MRFAEGATASPPAALVPTLVFVGTVTAVMSSLGAPLIPSIAHADHVSLSTGQWLLTAALLTGALATPVMGRLADGSRQRDVILVALGVVFVGCVLAATADTFVLVVLGRALQGVGLGLLPVTMAIARRTLSREHAAQAIATLSITVAVGAGIGYPLTGLIAELVDVHAAFWFGAIMVAAAFAAAVFVLPVRSEARRRPFDTVGAITLSVPVFGMLLVLSEGGSWGWASVRSLAIVAISVIFLVIWVFYELVQDDPLVELRQVRNRSVLTADIAGFLICISMYLIIPILVEFAQIAPSNGYGFGSSVLVSGLIFVPLSVATFLASRLLGLYERHLGTRSMIPAGSLVFAAACLFFTLEHRSLWELFVASTAIGLGMGLTFAAMPGFIVRAVPQRDTGSAMGFYQVLRNVGLSVGSALAAAILTANTLPGHELPTLGGFEAVPLVAIGLLLATAVISYVLPGSATNGPPVSGPVATAKGPTRADVLAEEEAEFAGTGAMLAEEDLRSEEDGPADPRRSATEGARSE